ncbi:hypothetical protein Dimus_020682, partial [Dionaea muscipula]
MAGCAQLRLETWLHCSTPLRWATRLGVARPSGDSSSPTTLAPSSPVAALLVDG